MYKATHGLSYKKPIKQHHIKYTLNIPSHANLDTSKMREKY